MSIAEVKCHHSRESSLSSLDSMKISSDSDHAMSFEPDFIPDINMLTVQATPEVQFDAFTNESFLTPTGSISSPIQTTSFQDWGWGVRPTVSTIFHGATNSHVSLSPNASSCREALPDLDEVAISLFDARPLAPESTNKGINSREDNLAPIRTRCASLESSDPQSDSILSRPSLHRRVSYDMLPSPNEIHERILLRSPTYLTPRRSKHRRNTTQIIVPP
jgi:hypothetical protein